LTNRIYPNKKQLKGKKDNTSMFTDQKRYLRFLQISSDAICLAVVYCLFIPFFLESWNFSFSFFTLLDPFIENHLTKTIFSVGLSPVYILMPMVIMVLLKTYEKIGIQTIKTTSYQSGVLSILATGILFLLFFCLNISLKENLFSSMISAFLLFPLLALNRYHIFYLIKKSTSNSNLVKHLLLVGTGPRSQSIFNEVTNHPEYGLRITGFLRTHDNKAGEINVSKKILGDVSDLINILHENYTDCVVCTGDNESIRQHEFLLKSCSTMGIDFATSKLNCPNKGLGNGRIFSEHIGELELKILKFIYLSPEAIFLKRIFDFTVSSLLIVLCLPFWIAIPISIKATSPGTILFRQKRIGKYGKEFILFKFRSMVTDAEEMQQMLIHLNEMDGPAFKIKKDPRLTTTGKFLRKSSLDELPQLFNVFRGDISLVGPRPATKKEIIQYRPIERKRLSVIQGITCVWQVSGRNNIKFDEWMKLDLMYIDHWSSAQDLRILFKTIPAVLLRKGAY
jgi:exopolysaccharide biosynthesis polyprenyl glycosylphosphotransferase